MTHADGGVRRYWVDPTKCLEKGPEGVYSRPVVLASDYALLEQQVAAFKKQCACRWCSGHHFNVAVCSKCAFSKKHEPHYAAQLEQQVEQLQGELQHWKDCYNGAEKARSEEQAAHSQRMHQMEHRAEQAEGRLTQYRDRMPKRIKLAIAADGDDVCEQIDKLVDAYEQAEARVKELEDQVKLCQAAASGASMLRQQAEAHLATATARVKWLEEGVRKFGMNDLFVNDVEAGEYADWLATEPKEQG